MASLPPPPSRLMLGFMGITAFLSMWISNTATTAMMVPIVEAILQQMEAASTAEAGLGALELADRGKASQLPGEPPPAPPSPVCTCFCSGASALLAHVLPARPGARGSQRAPVPFILCRVHCASPGLRGGWGAGGLVAGSWAQFRGEQSPADWVERLL